MSARLNSLRTLSTRFILVLLALVALSLAGCRTEPIIDQGPTPIPPKATQDQVKQAIISAGAGLGWVMKEQAPGMIIGTLPLRDHVAVVEIPYTSRNFSIRYKDSTNLNFNSADHTIHKNYNSWVANLNRAISAHLSML